MGDDIITRFLEALDQEVGIKVLDHEIRAALAACNATIEPGWRPIEEVEFKNGDVVYLLIEGDSMLRRFGIKPGTICQAEMFSDKYWCGSGWDMNPTTAELIEGGAKFRQLPGTSS